MLLGIVIDKAVVKSTRMSIVQNLAVVKTLWSQNRSLQKKPTSKQRSLNLDLRKVCLQDRKFKNRALQSYKEMPSSVQVTL